MTFYKNNLLLLLIMSFAYSSVCFGILVENPTSLFQAHPLPLIAENAPTCFEPAFFGKGILSFYKYWRDALGLRLVTCLTTSPPNPLLNPTRIISPVLKQPEKPCNFELGIDPTPLIPSPNITKAPTCFEPTILSKSIFSCPGPLPVLVEYTGSSD